MLGANVPGLDYMLSFTHLKLTEATLLQMYFFHNRCFTPWVNCKGNTFTSFLFQTIARCISLNQPSLYTSFVDIIKEDSLQQVDFSLLLCCSWHWALHYLYKTLTMGVLGLQGREEIHLTKNLNVSRGMNTGCTDMEAKLSMEIQSQPMLIWPKSTV